MWFKCTNKTKNNNTIFSYFAVPLYNKNFIKEFPVIRKCSLKQKVSLNFLFCSASNEKLIFKKMEKMHNNKYKWRHY